jgi:hypothetical protein
MLTAESGSPEARRHPISQSRSVIRRLSSALRSTVPDAEHELWHLHYLQAIKTALDRLKT